MRPTAKVALVSLLTIPALAACQVKDDKAKETTASETTTAAQAPTSSESPTVETPAAPPPPQAVIQSQPGPNGIIVDLNKVQVTGNVLTVQVTVKGGPDDSKGVYMKNTEINVIDDATSQRYGMLKGADGKYLASPTSGDSQIGNYISKNESEIFWFKFPAPPATATTISINLPTIAPFDGVPVTR